MMDIIILLGNMKKNNIRCLNVEQLYLFVKY
jgi:hypothetical protein